MLKNRVIKTTITIGEEEKIFLSTGGRIDDEISLTKSAKQVYMRQDFEVRASANTGVNGMHTAEIKLFNLTDASSREIEKLGTSVVLEAGYEGETNGLFEGTINSVTRTKLGLQDSDIITTLFCVSGIEALQEKSFSEAVNFEDLRSFLARLAQEVGLNLVIDKEIEGAIFDTTFSNDIKSILRELSTEFNFTYYWTLSKLIVKAIKPTNQIKIVKQYTPADGLLDIPIITEKGIDLRIFLDPNIRNGDGFQLTSKFVKFNVGALNFADRIRGDQINTFSRRLNNDRYQGVYEALEITHSGSSHEDTWETFIVALGAQGKEIINAVSRVTTA